MSHFARGVEREKLDLFGSDVSWKIHSVRLALPAHFTQEPRKDSYLRVALCFVDCGKGATPQSLM